MALRFCESFDHIASATEFTRKWTDLTGSYTLTGGRFGSCFLGGTSNTRHFGKTLDAQATWIVGCAFYVNEQSGSTQIIFELTDSGTLQVELRLTGAQQLQLTRNGSGIATGATVLSPFTWYHVALKVTINNSGTYAVELNGVSEFSGSADTQNTANASANAVRFRASTANYAWAFDDIYICDGTGGAPTNDFLGDCRIQCLLPDGNGNSSQFDGSDGNQTDNYLLVDEADPDDDTTYVESPDVNDKDTYTYGNLSSSSGTVYGLQLLPYARKTDAGTRTIVSVARLSATETDSGSKALTTSYLFHPDIRESKPGGGVWTISDVNSAEFGIKVNA